MRSRSHLAILIVSIAVVPAAGQVPAFRPSWALRSTGQFVTLSAENTAVLCNYGGGRLRTFVAPGPIVRLEVTADEAVIRLQLADAQELCYYTQSGLPASKDQFTNLGPPRQSKFRMNARPDSSFVGRLEVVESESGRSIRRLEEVRYVSRARWSDNGTAEVTVGVQRAGRTGLSAFQFNPSTGELRELFWSPGNFDCVDYFAFDADRGYGVFTSREFVTSLIDLRTGKCVLSIDLRIQPPPPTPVPVSSPGWLTPGTAVVAAAGIVGFLIFLRLGLRALKIGLRALKRRIDRRIAEAPPGTLEAADYSEPFGN